MRSAWDDDGRTRRSGFDQHPTDASSSFTHDGGPSHGYVQQPTLPALTLLRSHPRYADVEQPRRNRSISEVTETPFGHSFSSDRHLPNNRTAAYDEDGRRSSGPGAAENRLPHLPRLSANVRRSNTISALVSSSPSQRSHISTRFPSTHSSGAHADRPPPFSPTRIFSRQLPAAADNSDSMHANLLSPLATSSGGVSTSGLPMIVSPSSSSTSKLTSSGDTTTSVESGIPLAFDSSPRKQAKAHVASACLNCKKAHLACDISRPCRRCVNLGKVDTCIDVRHKKRGRPRLRERELSLQNSDLQDRSATSGLPRPTLNEHSLRFSASQHPLAAGQSYQHMPSRPTYDELPFQSSYGAHGRDDRRGGEWYNARMQSGRREYFAPLVGRISDGDSAYAGRMRSVSAANPPTWQRSSIESPEHRVSETAAVTTSMFGVHASQLVVSFILSTSLHCVRCSEECQAVLGFAPRDLTDISFFELVHPIDEHRIERLWTSLITPVGIRAQAMRHYRNAIMALSPAGLVMPAAGTVFLQEDQIRLRTRSGSYEPFSVRLHLGAGLGADLFRDNTLELAYIVASVVKLGGSTHPASLESGVGASGGGGGGGGIEPDGRHPDPDLLRQARWHDGLDSRQFTSPSVQFSNSASSSSGRGTSSRSSGKYSHVDVSLATTPSALVC